MAIADSKSRITITIDSGVLERLDAYCERAGMSRSQYISYCVAHQLDTENVMTNGVLDAVRELFTNMATGIEIDEKKLAAELGAR